MNEVNTVAYIIIIILRFPILSIMKAYHVRPVSNFKQTPVSLIRILFYECYHRGTLWYYLRILSSPPSPYPQQIHENYFWGEKTIEI